MLNSSLLLRIVSAQSLIDQSPDHVTCGADPKDLRFQHKQNSVLKLLRSPVNVRSLLALLLAILNGLGYHFTHGGENT